MGKGFQLKLHLSCHHYKQILAVVEGVGDPLVVLTKEVDLELDLEVDLEVVEEGTAEDLEVVEEVVEEGTAEDLEVVLEEAEAEVVIINLYYV